MNWFIIAFKKGFTYQGRSRRKELGWFLLITFLIGFVIGFFDGVSEALGLEQLHLIFSLVNTLFSLVCLIPQINLTTRRLHDLGYSGWWQLTPIAMLIIALLFTFISSSFGGGVAMIAGITYILLMLFLIFKDGQKHPNKYGESPKYQSEATSYSEV